MRRLFVALACAGACQNGNRGGATPDAPSSTTPPSADVIRFLQQSSFGPSEALAAQAQSQGIEAYVDAQLALPATSLGTFPVVTQPISTVCPPTGAPPNCFRDNFTAYPVTVAFFQNTLTAPDQLRQRVAFALGQILVVSGLEVQSAYGVAAYQQLLQADAFANFRQLLEDVTLSPAMGRYLNMVNNDKPDPTKGTHPNENYARELMQLFSIGLVELGADGSVTLDESNSPIATYDQNDVSELARVFTGWTYPTMPGQSAGTHNPAYFIGPMIAVASKHDTGPKTILGGAAIPAGQTPAKDLADALDAIFRHPNVGPFIGRQLIQHLVTSNPSPAYVARISAVFADDGHGVRGNLAAVVKAILLDPEARGDAKTDAPYGKLREPALYITGLARAIGAQSDGVFLRNASASLEQDVYQAPSVFSFYPPDTPLPGTSLVSPPSQLFDSTTALSRPNFVYSLLYSAPAGTSATLADFAGDAADPGKLVDRLGVLFVHGAMSADVRQAIVDAVTSVAATDALGRARMAVYLVATSPQAQVEE